MLAAITQKNLHDRKTHHAGIDEDGARIDILTLEGSKDILTDSLYRFDGALISLRRIQETETSTRTRLNYTEKEQFQQRVASKFRLDHLEGHVWPDVVQDPDAGRPVSMHFGVKSQASALVELYYAPDARLATLNLTGHAAWLFNCLWPPSANVKQGLMYFELFGATRLLSDYYTGGFKFSDSVCRQELPPDRALSEEQLQPPALEPAPDLVYRLFSDDEPDDAPQPAPEPDPVPLAETVWRDPLLLDDAPQAQLPLKRGVPSPDLPSPKAARRNSLDLPSSPRENFVPAVPRSPAVSSLLWGHDFVESLTKSRPKKTSQFPEAQEIEVKKLLKELARTKPKKKRPRKRHRQRRLSFPGDPDPWSL